MIHTYINIGEPREDFTQAFYGLKAVITDYHAPSKGYGDCEAVYIIERQEQIDAILESECDDLYITNLADLCEFDYCLTIEAIEALSQILNEGKSLYFVPEEKERLKGTTPEAEKALQAAINR